jgi:hypothetical protein
MGKPPHQKSRKIIPTGSNKAAKNINGLQRKAANH